MLTAATGPRIGVLPHALGHSPIGNPQFLSDDGREAPPDGLVEPHPLVAGRLHPLILTWPTCEGHLTVPGTVVLVAGV
jgi:hypothetical protein